MITSQKITTDLECGRRPIWEVFVKTEIHRVDQKKKIHRISLKLRPIKIRDIRCLPCSFRGSLSKWRANHPHKNINSISVAQHYLSMPNVSRRLIQKGLLESLKVTSILPYWCGLFSCNEVFWQSQKADYIHSQFYCGSRDEAEIVNLGDTSQLKLSVLDGTTKGIKTLN